jgi:hypothetical protein
VTNVRYCEGFRMPTALSCAANTGGRTLEIVA